MAWASLVISIAALIVAILSAWYALRGARIGNALPGALEFLGQHRDFAPDRRFIAQELTSTADVQLGIAELPEEIRERVVRVSHYLDHLGVLVERDLVDAKLVAGFMGGSIIWLWKVLGPYIEVERERRGEEYQMYFEDLAVRMQGIEPAKVRRAKAIE